MTAIIFITRYICSKIGIEDKSEKFLRYNIIIVAFESIFLFLYFKNLKIKNAKIINLIEKIAPLTFAVYIIHDNPVFRKVLYDKVLHVDICYHNYYGLLIVLGSSILLFIVCILIEYLRVFIFKWVGNIINTIKNKKLK